MNKNTLTYLLEHPERITALQTNQLGNLLKEYPYFQAGQALYLKGLKNQESLLYNNQLKVTAAHSQDRTILFDFITSAVFQQNDISIQIKQQEAQLYSIPVYEALDVSLQVEKEEKHKANQVLDPEFFVRKQTDLKSTEPTLEKGKPLDFKPQETHSFSEWLKLTGINPIDRDKDTEHLNSLKQEDESLNQDRKNKFELIDQFINSSPKIKIKPAEESLKRNLADDNTLAPESLMTETLARVYVEQKNYKKAKQAYKILSLKYPEKSGFFADQIRAIEKLQDNKIK